MKKYFFIWVGFCFLFSAWGQEPLGFQIKGAVFSKNAELRIEVLDADTQTPLKAQVFVSEKNTVPLEGEPLVLHKSGLFYQYHVKNTDARVYLTVQKKHYTSVSLLGVSRSWVRVFLKPNQAPTPRVIVSGKLRRWKANPKGGVIYAGMIIQALGAQDLVQLDSNALISPIKDTIQLFGSREIPSNFVLPPQSFFLFPVGRIRLHKGLYRLPVKKNSQIRLVGVEAEIPRSDLIRSAIGGGFAASFLNKIHFKRFAKSTSFFVNRPKTKDLYASWDLSPQLRVVLKKPKSLSQVFLFSMADLFGDQSVFFPMEVRFTETKSWPTWQKSKTFELKSASAVGAKNGFFALAVGKNRGSGIVLSTEDQSVVLPAFKKIHAPKVQNHLWELKAGARELKTLVLKTPFPKETRYREEKTLWKLVLLPGAQALVSVQMLQKAGSNEGVFFELETDRSWEKQPMEGKSFFSTLRKFSYQVLSFE